MYMVIEGVHKDPNKMDTMDKRTKKQYGPMSKKEADILAKSLIQKHVDNFYHRAWVITK